MPKVLRRTEQGKADSAWLQNVLNNPNISVIDNSSGQKVNTEDLKSLVDQEHPEPTAAEKKTKKIQKKVEDQEKKDLPEEEQQRQEDQDKKQEDKQKDLDETRASAKTTADKLKGAHKPAQRIVSSVSDALDQPIQKAGHALDIVAAAKTPGGIGFLVVLLIFLLMVVVKVDQQGNTRIKQFWYLLNGKAHLDKSSLPPDAGQIQKPGTQHASGPGSPSDVVPQIIQGGQDIGQGIIDGVFPWLASDYMSPNSFRTGGPA